METFKAYVLIIVFVGALGFGGYWAATSLGDPQVLSENDDIKVIAEVPTSNTLEEPSVNSQTPSSETVSISEPAPETNSPTTSANSHASLIAALEKLITDNVLMKEGSRGTRVGTVQQFLNVYNNTSSGVDNDYGPGTKSKVSAFQKAVGLTADGQAGPATYKKMIEWLQKQ